MLTLKFRLGLFERHQTDPSRFPRIGAPAHLRAAREAARRAWCCSRTRTACSRLQADHAGAVAVIGPLADEAHEQLGTWIFDGDAGLSVPFLPGAARVAQPPAADRVRPRSAHHAQPRPTGVRRGGGGWPSAAMPWLLVLGEEAILSGEAHCRADITLPGAQQALIEAVAATGRRWCSW
jgi:beta-glucosidase